MNPLNNIYSRPSLGLALGYNELGQGLGLQVGSRFLVQWTWSRIIQWTLARIIYWALTFISLLSHFKLNVCLEVSKQIEFGRKVWYGLGEQVARIASKIKQ